jgi:hypothetical protein
MPSRPANVSLIHRRCSGRSAAQGREDNPTPKRHPLTFCSMFSYLALRCLLRIVLLRPRSEGFKELEIVVLRHELSVLRRQAGRPQLRSCDRLLLAAASRLLPRSRCGSFLVTPSTLLRWHRRLVARR